MGKGRYHEKNTHLTFLFIILLGGFMKKKIACLALAAGLVWGCVTESHAVDFKVQGEWFMGYGGVNSTLKDDNNGNNDDFQALQRLRLQLEAIVSENLSGTLQIQMGDTKWGQASNDGDTIGGALGSDGKIVAVRSAYIDWYLPSTELQFRMGIQGLATPNAAGGSAILDDQVAAIVANYRISDMASITTWWARAYNDNYTNPDADNDNPANFLDNVDYFGLSVPLSFEGFDITPWAMIGFVGQNSLKAEDAPSGFLTLPAGYAPDARWDMDQSYGTQFYAGLPVVISAFDPLNIEFDVNYGLSTGLGSYDLGHHRASAEREGFVVKALVEYAFDFGRLGLFGWYGSGDDGDLENGSERMPSISPASNFTSFMQDGSNGWSLDGGYDIMLAYDGTWGVGLQMVDMSFIEDLSHSLRVAYWAGTNSPSMMKYMGQGGWRTDDGIYLTTNDSLVEVNLDTTWQIYDNLQAVVELGYIFNNVDAETWSHDNVGSTMGKEDAWKASLLFLYSF